MKIWLLRTVLLIALIIALALVAIGCGDGEKEAWDEVVTANSAEAARAFLAEHPEGEFAAEALVLLDELAWEEALSTNTAQAVRAFLEELPESQFRQEAEALLDDLDWETARGAGANESYILYVDRHPDGSYVEQAYEQIEVLDWQDTQDAGTISALRLYQETYPSGRFVAEAEARIAELARDDSVFLAAQAQNTREAYESFLAEYPGHQREADARRTLEEILGDAQGRPITDLIVQNKIQAESRGSGIDSVSLEVRRLVQHEVTVLIPAGTFFVAQGSAQNMVTTAERTITLTGDDWDSVSLDAACANMRRSVPRDDDSFEIRASPQQAELGGVARLLAKRGASTDVVQAAVWIVTDNADYDDLGTLVSGGFGGLGGSRVIDESDAVAAMKTVDDAGIDITRKAIWKDRSMLLRAPLLRGPTGEDLKAWLEQRGR